MTIGEIIKKYRRKIGMTQGELAARIGLVGASGISKIESGVNTVSFDTVIEIAKVLGIDPMIFMLEAIEDRYASFWEYLPFLSNASDESIRTIRFMLGMPPKKIYQSSREIV